MPDQTQVVNVRHTDCDIYVGRRTRFGRFKSAEGYFGNPHKSVEEYEAYFYDRIARDPEFKRRVLELRGKRIGCWCVPDHQCHAEVIAVWLDCYADQSG